jgi:hypothetical protein
VQLEDPVLSRLHDILVTQGDYVGTEHFMEHSVTSKLYAFFSGFSFIAMFEVLIPYWKL